MGGQCLRREISWQRWPHCRDLLGGASEGGQGRGGGEGSSGFGGGAQYGRGASSGEKLPSHLERMAQCVLGQFQASMAPSEGELEEAPRVYRGLGWQSPWSTMMLLVRRGLRLMWKGHRVLSTSAWRSYA